MTPSQFSELKTRITKEEQKLGQYAKVVQRARDLIRDLMREGLLVEAQHRSELANARESLEMQTDLVGQLRAELESATPSQEVVDAGKDALAEYVAAPAAFVESIRSELAQLAELDKKRDQVFAKLAKKGATFDAARAEQRKLVEAAMLELPPEHKVFNRILGRDRRPTAEDFLATALKPSEYVFGFPFSVFESGSGFVSNGLRIRAFLDQRLQELGHIKSSIK